MQKNFCRGAAGYKNFFFHGGHGAQKKFCPGGADLKKKFRNRRGAQFFGHITYQADRGCWLFFWLAQTASGDSGVASGATAAWQSWPSTAPPESCTPAAQSRAPLQGIRGEACPQRLLGVDQSAPPPKGAEWLVFSSG